jgi:hypothetical protein
MKRQNIHWQGARTLMLALLRRTHCGVPGVLDNQNSLGPRMSGPPIHKYITTSSSQAMTVQDKPPMLTTLALPPSM